MCNLRIVSQGSWVQGPTIDNYIFFYLFFFFVRCQLKFQMSIKLTPNDILFFAQIFCALHFISVFLNYYSYIAFEIIPVVTNTSGQFFPSATNETKRFNGPCSKKIIHVTTILSTNFPSIVVSIFLIQLFFFFVYFLPFASYSSCFACFLISLWVPSYHLIIAPPFELLLKQPPTPLGKVNHLSRPCPRHKYLQKILRIDIWTESARGRLAKVQEERNWGRGKKARRVREKEQRTVFALARPNSFVLISFSFSPATQGSLKGKERNFI